jgi:hypothetical protein
MVPPVFAARDCSIVWTCAGLAGFPVLVTTQTPFLMVQQGAASMVRTCAALAGLPVLVTTQTPSLMLQQGTAAFTGSKVALMANIATAPMLIIRVIII